MNLPGYLLQVSLCSGVFYLFYVLVLDKFTFFELNRWYLLFSLLVSFIIPALNIPINDTTPIVNEGYNIPQIDIITIPALHTLEIENVIHTDQYTFGQFNWSARIAAIYLTVTALLIVKLVLTFVRFARRIVGSDSKPQGHVRIISNYPGMQNGSFFNYIFIRESGLSKAEIQQIFDHELKHVEKYHSIDRLLVKITQTILWFNPFIYGYAKSIEENHEFEVDQEMGLGADKQNYANLLLQLSIADQGQFFNSFSNVPLKKRMIMLFNQPTPNMKKIVYMLIVPMVLISCLAFARFEREDANNILGNMPNYEKLQVDSPKYRQKVFMTPKQREMNQRTMQVNRKMLANPDYQKKVSFMRAMADQTIKIIVKSFYVNKKTGKREGYLADYKNQEIAIGGFYVGNKDFNKMFTIGNEITFTIAVVGIENNGLLKVVPEYVINGKQKMLVMSKTPTDAYPFLFEVNKVRFADGTITRTTKYTNGKLQTADVKTNQGTVLTVNFRADDPDLSSIRMGDEVRFRFIHENKVADKKYLINDWVCISKDVKNYGIRNPDFFYKFYTKS